jgi:hypothetical protein
MKNMASSTSYNTPLICLYAVNAIFVAVLSGCIYNDEASESGPEPNVSILSVKELGVIEETSLIRGRDGGQSAVFNSYSVWIFGDTFLNQETESGQTLIGNSWSWTDDFDASDGIDNYQEKKDSVGTPTEFLPLTAEEKQYNDLHNINNCQETPCGARWALWPGAFVADPERDRMLVFYEKIHAEPGIFNFYSVGHSLALWNEFEASPERLIFNRDTTYPSILFLKNEPGFGNAAIVVDSQLYVYGCDLAGVVKPCRLGRVLLESVDDRDQWEFYSGGGHWSKNNNDALAVFNGNEIMSVSYNQYLGRYLAVYSQPLDTAVMFRTAEQPEGPWSRPLYAFNAKAPLNDIGWVYDALEHPEYAQREGRDIYITYTREVGFLTFEIRLIAVEVAKTTQ